MFPCFAGRQSHGAGGTTVETKTSFAVFLLMLLLSNVASSEALEGLELVDAAFAQKVVNRQPVDRLTQYVVPPRGEQRAPLFLWTKITCRDTCLDRVQRDGSVSIVHYWYLDYGGGVSSEGIKTDSIDLSIKGEGWRTFSNKVNLQRGRWIVKVEGDGEPLCLGGSGQCEFRIEVK
jgi:hypothetical protein